MDRSTQTEMFSMNFVLGKMSRHNISDFLENISYQILKHVFVSLVCPNSKMLGIIYSQKWHETRRALKCRLEIQESAGMSASNMTCLLSTINIVM